MTPKTDILEKIFGGDHFKNLLGSIGWGGELLYALSFLASIVALIISITKLATASGNPVMRTRALAGILISGVCIAVLGGVGFVFLVLIGFI